MISLKLWTDWTKLGGWVGSLTKKQVDYPHRNFIHKWLLARPIGLETHLHKAILDSMAAQNHRRMVLPGPPLDRLMVILRST